MPSWNKITIKFKNDWNDQFKKMEESYDLLKIKLRRKYHYKKTNAKRDLDYYLQTSGWSE